FSITPATSCPGARGSCSPGNPPDFTNMSLWQMPQARTRTRTSPAPGCGTARSLKTKGPFATFTCAIFDIGRPPRRLRRTLPYDHGALKAASCRIQVPLLSAALALWLPAEAPASSTMSPSGEVMTRLVKPDPGAVKTAPVIPAAKSRSVVPVVLIEPVAAVVPVPVNDVPTSKGLVVRTPEYSV